MMRDQIAQNPFIGVSIVSSHDRVRRIIIPVGLFLAATLVHALWSWGPSYWYDEAATLRLATLQWTDFVRFIGSRDVVHAVYAAAMHVWMAAFGDSELSMRLPSAIATGLAAVGVFAITRRMGGTVRGAMAAATVFVFLPRILVQGVEARSYMISTALLVAAALLALLASAKRRVVLWVAYVVTAALGVWVFAYAVLVLPALALLADDHRGTALVRARRLCVTVGLPLALSAPLFLAMLGQQGQVAWLDEQPINFWTVLIEPFFNWAVWLAAAAAVIVSVSAFRGGLPSLRRMLPLWCWLILPTAALLAISLGYQPMFAPRYITISAPAVAIILGLAVSRWSRRTVIGVTAAWVVAAVPSWFVSRLPDSKPGGTDYRAIAEVIRGGASQGDSFFLENTGTGALRARTTLAAYPSAFSEMDDIALSVPYVQTGTFWDKLRTLQVEDMDGVMRLWVAARSPDLQLEVTIREAGFKPVLVAEIDGVSVTRWDASR